MKNNYSILLIIPYFGQWPIWFEATMVSMAGNPSIHWLCPTDCELPESHPVNLKFLPITLKELNIQVNSIVEANVPLTPRKFCDLKPAYGAIFEEYIRDYDFWGICDMDIIWGDIRNFMTRDILEEFDIISSRKQAISGHFNLFRNSNSINQLYKSLPNYKELFEHPKFQWTDEVVLTNYINDINARQSEINIKVYWPKILCNQENGMDSHQDYYLDKWLWKNGQMLELKNHEMVGEVMYLHFINWKRTLEKNEVHIQESPESFYISFDGIRYAQNALFKKIIRHTILNKINGYWIKEKRRISKNKLKSFIKRLRRKLGI